MKPPIDLSWTIFQEPQDDMSPETGALLTNWNGATGRDVHDMARAYTTEAFRLLKTARNHHESWESIDPILFCFRHALELHLKALVPERAKGSHRLLQLADELHRRLQGRYDQKQVDWLCERLREFDRIDSRSTSFRYHDVVEPNRDIEIWVSFDRLEPIMEAIFDGLERVWLASFERGRTGLSS